MNKMALFVEGRTELEFDSKLIQEIASNKRPITIKAERIIGGAKVPKKYIQITVKQVDVAGHPSTHFFMLYDCANDTAVKTRMVEEYAALAGAGYTMIICHRDVAPLFTYADLPRLVSTLPWKVKTKPIAVTFVLSVMEVEAWFLAEHTHFARIDPTLTPAMIHAKLGFDPSADDLQLRPTPADDLHNCYALAGKKYDKPTSQATIDALDYTSVVCDVADRFPHLKLLCDQISAFLDQGEAPGPV